MPKLRNNKLSTLNNKNVSTGSNTDKNLKYYKRRMYNTRRPQQVKDTKDKDISLPENYVGISQTNFIPCPDCQDLIDIREPLENKDLKINCPKCGLFDIDLLIELKRNNKIDLIESAGYPSGSLINPRKVTVSDLLVRPTQIKKHYVTDAETGIKRRVYDDANNTVNSSMNKNKKILNKDIVKEYDEDMDEDERTFNKPLKSLIDKAGLQITGVYDVKL